MTEIRCAKCCKITDVDDEDMWQGNLEDVADDHLIFRFTHYCDNEIGDDKDWEECGHTIEVLRYAKLSDHRDIEQEE
jgi:hypothetical protein